MVHPAAHSPSSARCPTPRPSLPAGFGGDPNGRTMSHPAAARRVEVIGDATLYLGDCLEILPELGRVDAVVSDPPYGIGYSHGGENHRYATRFANVRIVGDDRDFDPTPWLRWPCCLWGANHYSRYLPRGGRWLVWDKRAGMANGNDLSDVEIGWVSGRRASDKIFRLIWNGYVKGGGEKGIPRCHPTQKPIELMKWSLGFLPAAQIILDPFAGSGTTGVACMRLGRKFIGIEVDEHYFDIACSRIAEAERQPDMFVQATRVEQNTLF